MQEIKTARLAIDPKLNFFIMPHAHQLLPELTTFQFLENQLLCG
jgi:hypothetical protein